MPDLKSMHRMSWLCKFCAYSFLRNAQSAVTQHMPMCLQPQKPQGSQQSPKQSPKQNGTAVSSRTASRTFSGLMADVPACLSFSDLSNSYPADFESEYGPNHPSRELVRTARRVVLKVCVSLLFLYCSCNCHTSCNYCEHYFLHHQILSLLFSGCNFVCSVV